MISKNFTSANLKDWENIPLEQKAILLVEAKDYLKTSIPVWDESDSGQRNIVALARFAFRWNSNGGPKQRIKALDTEIRELKRCIERRKKFNEPYEAYSKELVERQEQLTKMQEMYPDKPKAA